MFLITIVGLFSSVLSAVVPLEEILMQMIPQNAVQLSNNYRVIEKEFSVDFLSSIDLTIADRLRLQPAVDAENDAFTPQLEQIFLNTETTPFGTLTLADVIHIGNESLVFTVVNRSDLVIIYQANCDSRNGPVHPLLLAQWASYGDELPRILFVSPPALLPLDRPLKLKQVLMQQSAWYDCMSRNGVVRYMIMETTRVVKAGKILPEAQAPNVSIDEHPVIDPITRFFERDEKMKEKFVTAIPAWGKHIPSRERYIRAPPNTRHS